MKIARTFLGRRCAACGTRKRYGPYPSSPKGLCCRCVNERAKAWSKRHTTENRLRARRKRCTSRGRAADLYQSARTRARGSRLPFDLTTDWIQRRIDRGVCEVTGISFALGRRSNGHGHQYAPSLDRIRFGRGYVRGNVRVVVWAFNTARWNHGDAALKEFVLAWQRNRPDFWKTS